MKRERPYITKRELKRRYPWLTDVMIVQYLPPLENGLVPGHHGTLAWPRRKVINICETDKELRAEKERIARQLERDNRRRMLQESGDFIADVSHQLKTPLAGLRLWCELTDDSNGRENAAKELELVERMEHLVQGLLRLAKARDEGVPFRFAPCSLSALVSGCLDELRPLFPQKQVALAGDATLSCDSSWLGEAVSNVLKNAFEHTAANGVVAVQIAQEASTVTVTVRDNGGGVPEAELPRLFHRFVTSGNATPNSTGIGLAISRAIVERHHGSITAENTADGLLVTLSFPVIDGIEKLSYESVS